MYCSFLPGGFGQSTGSRRLGCAFCSVLRLCSFRLAWAERSTVLMGSVVHFRVSWRLTSRSGRPATPAAQRRSVSPLTREYLGENCLTVIAAIITSHFTAHATDSFITIRTDEGTYKVQKSQETKIVRVPVWRGAISYWGLATHDSDWSTLRWLRERAASASRYSSAEDFARTLACDLTTALRVRRFRSPSERGIGMHFSAYERIDGYWVPELFHIRNWENETYSAVQEGIIVTRETYGASQGTRDRSEADGDPVQRLVV